ncbi:MAG TPA: phospholipid carrier-dependent glycosyltransferase [Usitatibacter sp.]|nr:phospholipid carrier-dependent glycosyltransferase [Usitatibacter sp.]
MPELRPLATRLLLALLVLIAVFVAIDNMERALANPDEGRYSEISREMAQTGDWVTPRLNGIKYFEKPPLQYWATAAAFRAFGVNEPAARLYTFLCGLLTVLLVGYTGWRLAGPPLGLAAMLVLGSSPYYLIMGGVVTLDMGLTLWTTLTFCAFVLAERPQVTPRGRRAWMLIAWTAMALAMLSKGLVAIVFPAAVIGTHMLLRRDLGALRRMEWGFGLLLFTAIAAPWFVAVSYVNPQFPEFFFIHEHFARFLTHVHRRTEPWWYFLPIFAILGFLPWMLALPAAVRAAWRDPRRRPETPALQLATIWALFILAFFSASGSKLPSYILPALPPFALVVARYLVDTPVRTLARYLVPTAAVGIAVAVWAGWFIEGSARDAWTQGLYMQARPLAIAAGLALLAAPIAAAMLLWRERRWPGLIVAALGVVVMVGCVEDGYERLLPRQSGYDVAQKIKPYLGPGTRVYQVKMYDQTVPFYLGRTTKIVDYGDEFEMGFLAEPGSHIERWPQLFADWERPGEALAIMQPEIYEKFRAGGLPMQVIHEDPRRILVRKP